MLYPVMTEKHLAEEIAEAASLPIHLFRDQAERNRKRVRHLMRVGNLRFSLPAILAWEIANSVRGNPAAATVEEIEIPTNPSEPAKRWHEIVREQDAARFDSAPEPERLSLLLAESPPFRPFIP